MNRLVVDASVVLKWYLRDEVEGPPALAVLDKYLTGALDLIAPALLEFEVANGLRIAGNRGRISGESVKAAARAFLDLGIQFVPFSFYADKTFDFAEKCDLSIYDASYLALAVVSGVFLLTADKKLLEAAKIRGLPARRLTEFE